jgi:hypothetical protein
VFIILFSLFFVCPRASASSYTCEDAQVKAFMGGRVKARCSVSISEKVDGLPIMLSHITH